MMEYSQFSVLLDGVLDSVLESVPKTFTSEQFISAVRGALPVECGQLLSQSNSRTLHVWLSRWYLNRKDGIVKMETKTVRTINGNKSTNALWKNIRKA